MAAREDDPGNPCSRVPPELCAGARIVVQADGTSKREPMVTPRSFCDACRGLIIACLEELPSAYVRLGAALGDPPRTGQQQGRAPFGPSEPIRAEVDARVGAMYLQNSGQAVAVLSIQKYGLFGYSNVGIGAGILQGNNSGKSGTAGYFGEIDYRKPIGDVAAIGGLIGGYDKWEDKPFVGVKAGLEYRQSAHLGEWLDVSYAYENGNSDRGLLIGGGITYSF